MLEIACDVDPLGFSSGFDDLFAQLSPKSPWEAFRRPQLPDLTKAVEDFALSIGNDVVDAAETPKDDPTAFAVISPFVLPSLADVDPVLPGSNFADNSASIDSSPDGLNDLLVAWLIAQVEMGIAGEAGKCVHGSCPLFDLFNYTGQPPLCQGLLQFATEALRNIDLMFLRAFLSDRVLPVVTSAPEGDFQM